MSTGTVVGSQEADLFYAADGSKFIGLKGNDTLVFSGNYSSYNINIENFANLRASVSDASRTWDIRQIESLKFLDGTLNLSTGVFVAVPPPPPPPPPLIINVTEDTGVQSFDLNLNGSSILNFDWSDVPVDGSLPAGFSVVGDTLTIDTNSIAYDNGDDGVFFSNFTFDAVDQNGTVSPRTLQVQFDLLAEPPPPPPPPPLIINVMEDTGVQSFDLNLNGSSILNFDWSDVPVDGSLPAGFSVVGDTLTIDTNSIAYDNGDDGVFFSNFTFDAVDQNGTVSPRTLQVQFDLLAEPPPPPPPPPLIINVTEDTGVQSFDLNLNGSSILNFDWSDVPVDGSLPAGFSVVGDTLTIDTNSIAYDNGDDGVFFSNFTFDAVDQNGTVSPRTLQVQFDLII